MSNTARIIWKTIGVTIVAALLLSAAVWGVRMRPTDTPCISLTYDIKDRAERMYLTEAELNNLLRSEGLYPVGKQINLLSLHRIEQTIQHHPMVRTAECYLTPRNELRVQLTQRVPLLRVQTPEETYFIDTDRKVMQSRNAVRDSVLLVTGAIGVQSASSQLADFAEWLQSNRYWRKRILYLRLQNPQMVYLYLRGNQPRIVLGSMRGYERKLRKMRTFLDNSEEEIQGKNYYEYDIRFRGQVIGRY